MKTSTTFELARKAALNAVEAALRQSRNCTLRLVAKAAHQLSQGLTSLLAEHFTCNAVATSLAQSAISQPLSLVSCLP